MGAGQRRAPAVAPIGATSQRTSDVLATEPTPPLVAGVRPTRWGRLVDSQTAFDFVGARKWGFLLSAVLLIATVISLWARAQPRHRLRGRDLVGRARPELLDRRRPDVLEENGSAPKAPASRGVQSESTDFIKVQVADQPEQVGTEMRDRFAEAAGVDPDEINVNLVSSSWGSEITEKAVRALVIFLALVAVFISIRFEWRMAIVRRSWR